MVILDYASESNYNIPFMFLLISQERFAFPVDVVTGYAYTFAQGVAFLAGLIFGLQGDWRTEFILLFPEGPDLTGGPYTQNFTRLKFISLIFQE